MGIQTRASSSSSVLLLLLPPLILFLFSSLSAVCDGQQGTAFGRNYAEIWGGDHVKVLDGQGEVGLSMDRSSGSGFGSKLAYGSGYFQMKIKLPGRNTAGIVTAFYLSSETSNGHDELDFEFLGNIEGQPITLQTNVFANGEGNREQRIKLWFDPSASFHYYSILWNPYQIVFYVDQVPIRVFANKESKGISYPSQPMKITATLWNGEDWATDGGRIKVDWRFAPFTAYFQGFDVNGCDSTIKNDSRCSAQTMWWNSPRYQRLSSSEQAAYRNVKNKYMTYDYCTDVKRFSTVPAECSQ